MRGQDETSISQVGRRRGPIRELPSASSLVTSMSMEELRSFYQIPDSISLELLDGSVVSTVGEVDSIVYFTWEQFTTGLHFLVSSLVKQFLHVSWAPPTLIYTNAIWILIGGSVLNLLDKLDISLVEICLVYMLKLRTGGRLSMSAHNPRLKFITGLPDSLKIEEKEVVLVRGPWYETPDSLGFLFDVNQSLAFPGLF